MFLLGIFDFAGVEHVDIVLRIKRRLAEPVVLTCELLHACAMRITWPVGMALA